MLNLLATLTILTAIAPLRGDGYVVRVKGDATKADQQRIAKAVESIPACLRNCDGRSLRVNGIADERFATEAEYYQYVNRQTGREGDIVNLVNTGVTGSRGAIRDTALANCWKPSELREFFGNPARVLLHETAHKYDFACLTKGKKRGIAPFLKLGFKQKKAAYHGDPDVRRMRKELFALFAQEEKGQRLSKQEEARKCQLQAALQRKYDKTGAPSRFEPDRHALDNGAEYFAIAIETLVHDHAEFCSAYSDAERRWLFENLGACLSQLPNKAPCFGDGAGEMRGSRMLER